MKTMTCKQLAGACDQEFNAETFEKMGELSRTLAPSDAMIDDARIFFSSRGWTFALPGEYEILATFPADTAFSDDVIRSETLRVTIEEADADTATDGSQLLFDKGGLGFGTEQGLYLYMGGGDHLRFGASQLRQLVRDFPQAAQRFRLFAQDRQ